MTDMIDCCFMNSDFLEGRAVSVCFMTYFWPFGSVMTDMIDCCFINSDFLEGRAVSVCCMTYFWPFILFNIYSIHNLNYFIHNLFNLLTVLHFIIIFKLCFIMPQKMNYYSWCYKDAF